MRALLRGLSSQRLYGLVLPGLLGALLQLGTTGPTGATGTGGVPYGTAPYTAPQPKPGPNPLSNRAMWIWEMGSTDHANLDAIIGQAKAGGIRTVMIKSSDGTTMWPQFNPALVASL